MALSPGKLRSNFRGRAMNKPGQGKVSTSSAVFSVPATATRATVPATGQKPNRTAAHHEAISALTNNILAEQGFTNSNLAVRGVGGAVGAQEFTEAAAKVTGSDGKKNITFNYFIRLRGQVLH